MKMLLPPFRSLLLAAAALWAVDLQAQTPVYDYRVVNRYPHELGDYTQGLFFHEGVMWEGTGRKGQSRVRKYRLEDGETLASKRLSDRYFGEGIQVVGDRLFQLTWQSHIVFVYDLETLEQVGTHYNPTEGWGLAYDGSRLILSDGTDTLYVIDPETFLTERSVKVTLDGNPVQSLNELEYIDGEIWANVWQTEFIARIDPQSGVVNGIVNLTGLSAMTERSESAAVLNGIAYDEAGDRLFVTGKLWGDVFEIELVAPGQ